MIEPTAALIKFSLAVVGSGWLITASQMGIEDPSAILGGWALAVTGLVTFWKQSQKDRSEFRVQQKEEREYFEKKIAEERDRADMYHAEVSKMGEKFEKLTYSIGELIKKLQLKP